MGRTITFINEKGGIGKTSSCFNISWELVNRGKKVLMIDIDGQRANLTYVAGVEKTNEMLTIYDIVLRGISIRKTIRTVREGLELVPANSVCSDIPSSAKIFSLKKAIQEIKAEYDYIMIDVNPTPNWSHALAIAASDYLIIPMLPDVCSLEANAGIAESIEDLRGYTPELKVLGILFNKYDNRTNLAKQVRSIADGIAEQLDTRVFDTYIHNAVAMGESVYPHIGITDYQKRSAAAEDIRMLVTEIEERIRSVEAG